MKYKIEANIYKQWWTKNKPYVIDGYYLYTKRFIFWKFVKFSKDIKELIKYINKNK